MASSSSTIPVLISGAGPTGLAAALVLLRNGIAVRVIDKLPAFNPGTRGPGLQPRTLELFHQAGAREIIETGQSMIPIRTYKPGTLEPEKDRLVHKPRAPSPHFPYGNIILLGQNMTEHHLRAQIAKYEVYVELGTELRSFEQDANGVTVHLIKKQQGSEQEVDETVRAQYLVGTDGARSAVRKLLGCTFLGETRDDTRLITGDVRIVGEGLGRDYWHQFGDGIVKKGLFLRPCNSIAGAENDGFQLMLGGSEIDISATVAGGREAIYALIQELVPTKLEFRELIWFGEFRPNIRMADKFGEGRVFIAGDAAHCHSPAGGQGLNSSVQDAFNLAWKLSLVLKDLSPPSLLSTYTTERLPVIAEMLNLTTSLFNQTTAGDDRAFERSDRLLMLGVNYRTSPIVHDELSPPGKREPVPAYGEANEALEDALVAGDRAPDAPGLVDGEGRAYRVFDILKVVRHTVLVFVPSFQQAKGVVQAIKGRESWGDVVRPVVVLPAGASIDDASLEADGVLVLRDAEQFAYAGFRAKEGESRVVIVRPDGYVGAVVRGVEGMERYFSGIFV
ncbi:hypothetical protein CONPUDRAFT_127729 [Coniophora puteana RWD-64-598 SS2]|uniref:FAD-binding domain-containing protein n=1 Tax=Coniophora puteana (strain RWD-64-598) TaxID=741705 RepID=A0A5M3MG27_CONPW|nr:uncharacterized protein CONPUDRAFT_127729 [Coniophora puteana RWD-64-598 SS2]EIW78209.1 hypothetical protein CONPUDRAFT_127729 [Coniophora puteana RWD-64-598 SS2]